MQCRCPNDRQQNEENKCFQGVKDAIHWPSDRNQSRSNDANLASEARASRSRSRSHGPSYTGIDGVGPQRGVRVNANAARVRHMYRHAADGMESTAVEVADV